MFAALSGDGSASVLTAKTCLDSQSHTRFVPSEADKKERS
jgi:hypothetical protein